MGNLVGGKKSHENSKNDNLIDEYFNKFINHSNETFDFYIFQSDLFLNLNVKLIDFLNDVIHKNNQKTKNTKTTITDKNFNLSEFRILFNILTNHDNFLSNEENSTYIYFRKNMIYLLYDIYVGKVGASQDERMDINKVIDIFDFLVHVFISKHKGANAKMNYKKQQIEEYFSLNNINQADSNFTYFIDHTLYSLDSFIKNYFKLKFLTKNEDVILSTGPLCSEYSSILTIPQFFFFTLANSLIYQKRYAFKLYDCHMKGYNMSSIIYSFIGFPGPIVIFLENFDKKENKEYILGAFINSNFKECYEKFCGDDLSFVFTIMPEMKFYKFRSNPDKICFISSKPQKYSKAESGIGLGYGYEKFKLWIDGGDLFNKSYFEKYDDVFEEGTPFKDLRHYLNVSIKFELKMYFYHLDH